MEAAQKRVTSHDQASAKASQGLRLMAHNPSSPQPLPEDPHAGERDDSGRTSSQAQAAEAAANGSPSRLDGRGERDLSSPENELEDRVLAERFLAARTQGARQEMEASFRVLLLRYQERVHKLVFRYTKDALEAEDVTQEVFLKVFKKLDSFQWDAALYTWLYRIAVNTAVDYMSKKKRRPIQFSENVSDLAGTNEDPSVLRASSRAVGSPEEPLFEQERAAVTREILEELPDPYKTVLILREFEDMSYVDMSETIGCSLGTVESRLFRARARFRKILEQRHPELLQ